MNTTLYHKYLTGAKKLFPLSIDGSRHTGWESPSNIALIKYWGKYGEQLPRNPSVSFTLNRSTTSMRVTYQTVAPRRFEVELYFESERNLKFEDRIRRYLDRLRIFFPFLDNMQLRIESSNSFPHSSGIASSASSFSAMALCLCNIERDLFGTLTNPKHFFQKASFMSRLGSGSASRSVYGGTTLWGLQPEMEQSSDESAIPIQEYIHPVFQTFRDSVLIIHSAAKKTSSTHGHALMEQHWYAKARYEQASYNIQTLLKALQTGNEETFSQIVENEALSLHGLMFSSSPGVLLLHPNTLLAIEKIRAFRESSGLNISFTLDAGPNVHVLYPEYIRESVLPFIHEQLVPLCENDFWIDDQVGNGPKVLAG